MGAKVAENRFKKYVEPTPTVFYRDPVVAAEQQRAAEDQEFQRRQLGISAAGEARQADKTATDIRLAEEKAARERAEWNAKFFPDGRPRPKGLPQSPQRPAQIRAILENIQQLRALSDENLAVGSMSGYVKGDGIVGSLFGQNRKNVEGAVDMVMGDLIQQQIALLSAANGGNGVASMANSQEEARRMAASIANLSPDQDREQFLKGLQRAEDYYLRQAAILEGGEVADEGVRRSYLPDGHPNKPKAAIPAARAAGAGATETTIPIPPEMQAEHAAYLEQNWGRITPDGYAAFRAQLDRKYDFTPDDGAYRGIVEGLNKMAAEGQSPTGLNIPAPARELSDLEQGVNDFVNNPWGRFTTATLNSALVGAPGALAGATGYGENLDLMREESSGEMFAGDVLGGLVGTGLVGGGLRLATKMPINPLWSDAAYSTIYGSAEGEDPVTGALMGLTGSLGGSIAGRYAGRALPRLTGAGPQPELLTAGERAAYENAGDLDDIALSLFEADQLGVPMSLADSSPGLNSLAGAAARQSPAVAGNARDMVFRRGEGQGDRLIEAVERDLGPVANIPATSEALVQQARARAAPLYEAAYAAPGASTLDLSDLYARPSMRSALSRAYRIAQEEGRDPMTLGFVRSEDAIMGEPLVRIENPSWQTLDYLKRGLDDTLEGYRDGTTGRLNLDTEGRAIEGTRQAFLQRVDAMNPDYAAARAAYAGPVQERAFMERGQDALTADPQQLAVDLDRLTPQQVAQMRLGYQSRLTTRGGDLRNNSNPWGQLNTPNTEQRLGTLYDGTDADIANLLAQRDLELQLAGSGNRLVGNSLTAERTAADQAFKTNAANGGDAMSIGAETLISGAPWVSGPRALFSRFMSDRRNAAAMARNQDMADDIGSLLLDDNPAQSMVILDDLSQRAAEEQALLEAVLSLAGRRGERIGSALGTAASVGVSR